MELWWANRIIACTGLETQPRGLWGAATETSRGKDTPSGHWELAGLPVPWDWHYFPDEVPAFPDDLTAYVAQVAGTHRQCWKRREVVAAKCRTWQCLCH